VNSGILFYLYLADVSVPILGTNIVETPEISGYRSAVYFILFLPCLYFGFTRRRLQTQGVSHSFDLTLFEQPAQLFNSTTGAGGGARWRPAVRLGHDPIELLAARGVSAHNGGQFAEHNKQYATHFQFCPRTDVVATRIFVTLAKLQMAGACLLDVRTPAITSRPSDTSPERTARPRVRLLL